MHSIRNLFRRWGAISSVAALLCYGVAARGAEAMKPLSGPSKVTVRDDRTILVNNEAFFPLGLYYAEEEIADKSGKLLKDLREMGFNTLFFSSGADLGRARTELDRIAAAGLRVQYRPPGALIGEFDALKKTINAFKNHPTILFWEHADEPIVNQVKIEQARPGYAIVKQLDPNHPVLCVQWPDRKKPELLKQWGTLCDVYGLDKYPVPRKRWFYQDKDIPEGVPFSIAVMGHDTKWMQSFVPNKPIIAVEQAWQIHGPEDGAEGLPTTAESRFMAYQVVIAGAKGILYYGKIRASAPAASAGLPEKVDNNPNLVADFKKAKELNDAFWAYFKPVLKELSEMAPVFASRDADWKPQVKLTEETGAKPAEIELVTKQHGQTAVILLVNASEKPAKIQVTAPKFSGGKIFCWYDNKELTADGSGNFSDQLKPFDVRVYSNQPSAAAK